MKNKFLAKLNGLTEEDFKPKKLEAKNESDADRIAILEDAFAELCEIVFAEEEENNG